MKTIKIKDIEISAEELRRIVSENKELLKEPEFKGRYFFPNEGEKYYWVGSSSDIYYYNNTGDWKDKGHISIGNCYRTEAEAQLAQEKQKAIIACWKWAQENAPFEPDWGDDKQDKYYCVFNHDNKTFEVYCYLSYQQQFTLPYFKSEEDCCAFIKACKEHLTLLFTK